MTSQQQKPFTVPLNVDRVWILTCDKVERDNARVNKLLLQLQQSGWPSELIEIFPASDGYALPNDVFVKEHIEHDHPGARGCALSHKRMWKEMIQRNYQRVLIFEDDVVLHESFNELVPSFNAMTNQCDRMGMTFLGYCSFDGPAGTDSVIPAFPASTHAYVITAEAAKWWIKTWETDTCKINVDSFMWQVYTDHVRNGTCPWRSYVWWNGAHKSKYQKNTRLNVYFRGLVYQDHDLPLSIHRGSEVDTCLVPKIPAESDRITSRVLEIKDSVVPSESGIMIRNFVPNPNAPFTLPLNVDKVWILSCDQVERDHTRLAKVLLQMKEAGWPSELIEIFPASDGYSIPVEEFAKEHIEHENPGFRGVALSHKRMWKEMIHRNYNRVLIFEDDAILHESFNQLVPAFNAATEKCDRMGMTFLGHCGYDGPPGIDAVYHAYPLAMHAYVITNEAAKWWIKKWYKQICTINNDLFFKETYENSILNGTCPWRSYMWWNGAHKSKYQKLTRLNVYFRGLVYQDHDLPLSIHRGSDNDTCNVDVSETKQSEAKQAPMIQPRKATTSVTPKYYSQYQQDQFIYQTYFKHRPPAQSGVFVDIGAHDGILLSNSKFFEEIGWKGVCVEPIPEIFDQLRKNRSCVCVQCCIADTPGDKAFLRCKGYTEMLSGLADKYHPDHLKRIEKEIEWKGGSMETITVKVKTFDELMRENNITHIDYLSIDTEGNELDIIRSIDFDKYDIDVMSVEKNYDDSPITAEIMSKGYDMVQTLGCDQIFKKRHVPIGANKEAKNVFVETPDETPSNTVGIVKQMLMRANETQAAKQTLQSLQSPQLPFDYALVTMFYDLKRREPHSERRDAQFYLSKAQEYTLTLPCRLIVFTEDKFVSPILAFRRKLGLAHLTHIVTHALETLAYPKWAQMADNFQVHPYKTDPEKTIPAAYDQHGKLVSPAITVPSHKVTPLYMTTVTSKYELMLRAIRLNPFGFESPKTARWGWIDFGIGYVAKNDLSMDTVMSKCDTAGKIELLMMRPMSRVEAAELAAPTLVFNQFLGRLAGGFWTGSGEYMTTYCEACVRELDATLKRGYTTTDEEIALVVSERHPEWFIFHYGDYASCISNRVEMTRHHETIFQITLPVYMREQKYALAEDLCARLALTLFTQTSSPYFAHMVPLWITCLHHLHRMQEAQEVAWLARRIYESTLPASFRERFKAYASARETTTLTSRLIQTLSGALDKVTGLLKTAEQFVVEDRPAFLKKIRASTSVSELASAVDEFKSRLDSPAPVSVSAPVSAAVSAPAPAPVAVSVSAPAPAPVAVSVSAPAPAPVAVSVSAPVPVTIVESKSALPDENYRPRDASDDIDVVVTHESDDALEPWLQLKEVFPRVRVYMYHKTHPDAISDAGRRAAEKEICERGAKLFGSFWTDLSAIGGRYGQVAIYHTRQVQNKRKWTWVTRASLPGIWQYRNLEKSPVQFIQNQIDHGCQEWFPMCGPMTEWDGIKWGPDYEAKMAAGKLMQYSVEPSPREWVERVWKLDGGIVEETQFMYPNDCTWSCFHMFMVESKHLDTLPDAFLKRLLVSLERCVETEEEHFLERLWFMLLHVWHPTIVDVWKTEIALQSSRQQQAAQPMQSVQSAQASQQQAFQQQTAQASQQQVFQQQTAHSFQQIVQPAMPSFASIMSQQNGQEAKINASSVGGISVGAPVQIQFRAGNVINTVPLGQISLANKKPLSKMVIEEITDTTEEKKSTSVPVVEPTSTPQKRAGHVPISILQLPAHLQNLLARSTK